MYVPLNFAKHGVPPSGVAVNSSTPSSLISESPVRGSVTMDLVGQGELPSARGRLAEMDSAFAAAGSPGLRMQERVEAARLALGS